MALDVKRPKGYHKMWNGGVDPIRRECDQCGWTPGPTWKSERCGSAPFGSCDGTVRPAAELSDPRNWGFDKDGNI